MRERGFEQKVLDNEMELAEAHLNLDLEVFRVSARTGEGLDAWLAWLVSRCGGGARPTAS